MSESTSPYPGRDPAESTSPDQTQDQDQDQLDNSLRPRNLQDFVGQESIRENLSIAIQAALLRDQPLDHVILYGPPGLGKTTLAHIIAQEMRTSIKVTSGPAILRPADMAAILSGIQKHDILFIDEIHRINRVAEEILYSAMEDFFLSWMVGKGLAARSVNLSINPFTLVGATTRYSLISAPLRDRFGSVMRLDPYAQQDMQTVLHRSSRILDIETDPDGIREIAARSRGTPRIGNRLLKRARDYATVRADSRVTGPVALAALEMLRVDPAGLDESDRRLLDTIIQKFDGGPVGLETLSAALGEDPDTVMEVSEPYLLKLGFIERTPRGRTTTRRAHEYLGHEPNSTNHASSPQQRMTRV